MRNIALGLLLLAVSTAAVAQSRVRVDGYTRRDGTYVAPHYRTAPDSSRTNNWSSQGNTNPYTGERGTVNPYGSSNFPASGYQRDINGDGQPD